jgi:transposase
MQKNINKGVMSLHRFIPDSKIPLSLKEPLVFGDRRQIEALRDLEEDINLMETESAKIADEKLKYFDVTIEYGGTEEMRILAVDKEDAKDQAKQEASIENADIEVDFVSVREVKK